MNANEYLKTFSKAKYLVSLGNYQSYYYKTDSISNETFGNIRRDELCEALDELSDFYNDDSSYKVLNNLLSGIETGIIF